MKILCECDNRPEERLTPVFFWHLTSQFFPSLIKLHLNQILKHTQSIRFHFKVTEEMILSFWPITYVLNFFHKLPKGEIHIIHLSGSILKHRGFIYRKKKVRVMLSK